MTESEAIEYLTAHLECESRRSRIEGCNNNCNECELCYLQGTTKQHLEGIKIAIQALEEVQKYRAIGTPEECRAAMERNNEKTRIIDGVTECCGYDFGTDAFQRKLSKFCPVCGRKIERSDEE